MLSSQLSLFVNVVGPLLCNQPVSDSCSPIILKRHGWPISERLVDATEDVVNEVKATVKHLLLGRVVDDVFCVESMSKVVTNMDSELQTKCQGIGWRAIMKNGDEQVSDLVTACHMSCFFQTLPLVL